MLAKQVVLNDFRSDVPAENLLEDAKVLRKRGLTASGAGDRDPERESRGKTEEKLDDMERSSA